MARIAALGTIVFFAIQALLIGPDQVGYSEQYGAIADIFGFVQGFGILFTNSFHKYLAMFSPDALTFVKYSISISSLL